MTDRAPDIFNAQPDHEDNSDNPEENDEPENMKSDSEVEVDDSGSDFNPLEKFRVEVKESTKKPYAEQVKRFLGMGKSRHFAENAAFNVLLPLSRRILRKLYLQYLKWADHIKRDELH